MQQWALPSSLQICQATAPALQDKLSPQLLLPILASSVSHPYASIIFMICYISFCKLSPTCFAPCLLDYQPRANIPRKYLCTITVEPSINSYGKHVVH